MKRPLYIFDLDGTLADTQHRLHYLDNKKDPDRWRRFYRACHLDSPISDTIKTFKTLSVTADIQIWTGRSDEVKEQTMDWLFWYVISVHRDHISSILKMRKEGDYTPDHILKKSWLESMSLEDRRRLVAVFEDRASVVQMWRDNGVTCYQVAKGDF